VDINGEVVFCDDFKDRVIQIVTVYRFEPPLGKEVQIGSWRIREAAMFHLEEECFVTLFSPLSSHICLTILLSEPKRKLISAWLMKLFVCHYCEAAMLELGHFFCRRKYQVISILKLAWFLWDYVI
jgi:hypothetical protein